MSYTSTLRDWVPRLSPSLRAPHEWLASATSGPRAGARSPGSTRFKAECGKPWVEAYAKIKLLGDITPERAEILASNRWEWSQMGVVTVGIPEDLVMAVRRLQLKRMDALALLGWIVAQSAGGGIRPASRTT